MRINKYLLFAVLLAMFAVGCSDGKLNLLLVMWAENEYAQEESSSSVSPGSSAVQALPSSSSIFGPQLPGSSSKGVRPPPTPETKGYEDYRVLEVGDPKVKKGNATRYWDACKPHCSWPKNVENTNPYAICKNCDKNGNEMPAYFIHPDSKRFIPESGWIGGFLGTPSSCMPNTHGNAWIKSEDYHYGPAYTCWDMIPHIVNDTLAYAFAATPGAEEANASNCGKCFLLQFDGGVRDDSGLPRDSHRSMKNKKLVVMASNIGGDVGHGQFDIMIPGGGLGAFDGFSGQLGIHADSLGKTMGGLMSTCVSKVDYYQTPMNVIQECVREECNKVFGRISPILLKGCLFMADWYVADNPTLIYTETECPQYLIDRYMFKDTRFSEKPGPEPAL